MKNLYKPLCFVALLFLASTAAFSQQFSWLYPQPTGNERYSICKAGNSVYVGGYAGSVVKTTNDGGNWAILNTGLVFLNGAVEQVKFTDANTGFLAGQMYNLKDLTLRKTVDGGATWRTIVVASKGSSATVDLQFPSAAVGYLTGNSRVYKTTDAGETWTPVFDSTSIGIYPGRFSFIDDQEGWLLASNSGWPSTSRLYHTADGGATWSLIFTGEPGNNFTGIHFSNPYTGFVATSNTNTWPSTVSVMKITSDGSTVTPSYTGSGNPIKHLYFNGKTGYALQENQGLVKTSDFGQTWAPLSCPQLTPYLRDLVVEDATTVYVAGAAGLVQKTTDGGANWTVLTGHQSIAGGSMFAISTVDKTTIYAAERTSGSGNVFNANVYKSKNGGTTWAEVSTGISGWMNALSFGDNTTGFMVGQNASLLKTTDGGMTWASANTGIDVSSTSLSFNAVEALDASTAFVAGANDMYNEPNFGVIYKTTDGGATWEQAYYNTADYITSVHFYNGKIGIATGYRRGATYASDYKVFNLVLKTTDGGNTWNAITIGTAGDSYSTRINNVSFADANTIYASGYQRVVYKSTDGGETWASIDLAASVAAAKYMSIQAVHFADADNGYAFSTQASNLIVKTSDGGATWSAIDIGDWQIGNVNNAILPLTADKFITGGANSSLVLFSPSGNVTLPVKLQSFTGQLVKDVAVLQWQVAEETNLREYAVEQSFNGGSFSAIGAVPAGKTTYGFEQRLSSPGLYTFRLRSIDKSGHQQFSKTVTLKYAVEQTRYKITNPVTAQLTIEQPAAAAVEVRLMDMSGKLLSRTKSSDRIIKVGVSNLPSGTYTVQVIGNDGAISAKVIKQ